jgi:hypothetical protein
LIVGETPFFSKKTTRFFNSSVFINKPLTIFHLSPLKIVSHIRYIFFSHLTLAVLNVRSSYSYYITISPKSKHLFVHFEIDFFDIMGVCFQLLYRSRTIPV